MKYRASFRPVSGAPVAVQVKKTPRASEREFLTLTEVADLLRVSSLTVRRLIAAGRLDALRVGKQWRVVRDSIFNLRE